MDPNSVALLACTTYATFEVTWFMYHYNSHAANPIMLRSTKPQVMRDLFLVPSNLNLSTEWWKFLNPLPGLYAFSLEDALANSVVFGAVGAPLIKTIGFKHVAATYFLGSLFSGFAYVFQMQCSRTKKSTEFDCAAMSQGALAAVCSLSLLMPNQRIPIARKVPASIFASAYIIRSLVEEYGWNPFNISGYHKWFRTSALSRKASSGGDNLSGNEFFRELKDMEDLSNKYFDGSSSTANTDNNTNAAAANAAASEAYRQYTESADVTGHIELTNWGSIGGIFLGLIYGSLVIGVKKDFSKMGRFWSRMPGVGGSAKPKHTAPPPSWGTKK